jgi:endonuclease/exonuclease/phosphatase family metal-dependent hydrolase
MLLKNILQFIMKVVSWNILSDEFIDKKYYPKIPFKLLDRKKRFTTILETIKKTRADVIFLQEVMIKEYEIFKSLFKGFFVSKLITIEWKYPNENFEKTESGNIILLRKSMFTDFQYIIDDFCIVSCRYNNNNICFANVHLDDLSSIKRFKQIIRVIEKTNSCDKVIIGGDFNQKYNENTKLFKFFKLNLFKPSITNNDATYYIDKSQSIDNIMFRGFRLKTSSVSNKCGKRSIGNMICQINEYGSDHFPVIVEFH